MDRDMMRKNEGEENKKGDTKWDYREERRQAALFKT